jgi:hypothetical protein
VKLWERKHPVYNLLPVVGIAAFMLVLAACTQAGRPVITAEAGDRPTAGRSPTPTAVRVAASPSPTAAQAAEAPPPTEAATPSPIPPGDLPALLHESVAAAASYLVAHQLSNGELPYKVDILTNDRSWAPSNLRLVAATGSLYTACRVVGDDGYCRAADRSLAHYLNQLVEGEDFDGMCLYSGGRCKLGGTALTVDAIYKRWQATGSTTLGEVDLLETALRLGEHIIWMRRPEGGFYHAYDPHFGGAVDEAYHVSYFPGESLMALLELYELTDDPYWLEQAREVNAYMIRQPVDEDHWHAYAFNLLARLDELSDDDSIYGVRIGQAVIEGQSRSLDEDNSSISTATKLEAVAALALAFEQAGVPHGWLAPEAEKFALFVLARQLPGNLCGWPVTGDLARFEGGIYRSCDDPTIRVDGPQHWINGVATYLEYLDALTLPYGQR